MTQLNKENIILDNKFDHILQQNKNLKDQIQILSKRIEENLHRDKSTKVNESVTEDMSIAGEDYMPIYQQINRYKEHVLQIKAEMEGLYNLNKLENLENEIKKKKEILHNLKLENNVLTNINKNQSKAKVQFEQKYENKNEVKLLQERLRTLKEEFKYSRELHKNLEDKIKKQNTIILNLEEKCSKIKDNIEFKKRSQTGSTNKLSTYLNPEEDDLNYLEEKAKYLDIQVQNEEKNYKFEMNRQQGIISKLSEELSIINIQLKEKEQEIRINELKLKELNKINKHTNDIVNVNKQNTRHKSNEQVRMISANNNDNRSKSKPLMSRTPNNMRNNKPFDIKFKDNNPYDSNIINRKLNTNYNQRNNNLPQIENKYKEKEDMLNQIENLKNELKNALHYNENLFRKELDNDNFINDNQIFNNQISGSKEQSLLISNKELFEKIDQSMINEEKENVRKPFKPILFNN